MNAESWFAFAALALLLVNAVLDKRRDLESGWLPCHAACSGYGTRCRRHRTGNCGSIRMGLPLSFYRRRLHSHSQRAARESRRFGRSLHGCAKRSLFSSLRVYRLCSSRSAHLWGSSRIALACFFSFDPCREQRPGLWTSAREEVRIVDSGGCGAAFCAGRIAAGSGGVDRGAVRLVGDALLFDRAAGVGARGSSVDGAG